MVELARENPPVDNGNFAAMSIQSILLLLLLLVRYGRFEANFKSHVLGNCLLMLSF